MPHYPKWLTEGRKPPEKYERLKAQLGADLLAGKESIASLQAEHGLSNYEAATLSKWVREANRTQAVQQAPEPTATSMPTFSRWDLADKVDDIRIPKLDPDAADEEDQPIEELLEERRARYLAKKRKWDASRVHRIKLDEQRAIGICAIGDPHLDDDGCDIPEMLRTIRTICSTEGLYALGLGDTTNGAWPGRLTAQWAHQSTTMPEQVRLARWFYHSAPFLACVLGNHDLWGPNGSALHRYLTKGAQIRVLAQAEARLELVWPRGQEYRIVARHTFAGRSQWHSAHGAAKYARLVDGGFGNAYLQGHIHSDWVSQFELPGGKPCIAGVVRGFKAIDGYADERGFKRDHHGASLTLVLDPAAKSPMDFCKVFWDVEAGADYLGWLRRRG